MSVKDLERHLRVGWQTIAQAGAVVGVIALAARGYLPVPIAVLFALLIPFWGALNIIDSNYWSQRAIGFLANVEAVYFSQSDVRHFHPYVGHHPRYKLLDSLKYQLWVVIGLVGVVVAFFVIKALQWADKSGSLDRASLALWGSPIVALCLLLTIVVWVYQKRARDYHDFVSKSPGPGIRTGQTFVRGVDLTTDPEGNVISAEDWQHETKKQVERAIRRWRVAKWAILLVSLIVFGLYLIALVRG